jgi:hypothetical protein
MFKLRVVILLTAISLSSCQRNSESRIQTDAKTEVDKSDFRSSVSFLKQFTEVILLGDSSGTSKIALLPALQGRVMTSTSEGDGGLSYGWINQKAFISGDTSEHMNAYGGEERFWLGPEGGQFGLYFEKGKDFTFDNWHVPRFLDLEPFDVRSSSSSEVVFGKKATLTNYAGTVFEIDIERKIKLLTKDDVKGELGVSTFNGASVISYQSKNKLTNKGETDWKKETGLLSIWILGMYNPSNNVTVIIPHNGGNKSLNQIVNDKYFGDVPEGRLRLSNNLIFFKCDGKYRSKIGLPAAMATDRMGSYDADNGVLTMVKYSKDERAIDYVNSLWEIQKEPYRGDVVNSYNDGPPSPGVEAMGPFYELESSSPAVALKSGDSLVHTQTTFHIKGTPEQLDPIMKQFLGASIAEVLSAFQ